MQSSGQILGYVCLFRKKKYTFRAQTIVRYLQIISQTIDFVTFCPSTTTIVHFAFFIANLKKIDILIQWNDNFTLKKYNEGKIVIPLNQNINFRLKLRVQSVNNW